MLLVVCGVYVSLSRFMVDTMGHTYLGAGTRPASCTGPSEIKTPPEQGPPALRTLNPRPDDYEHDE